jgi:hypothetical protein
MRVKECMVKIVVLFAVYCSVLVLVTRTAYTKQRNTIELVRLEIDAINNNDDGIGIGLAAVGLLVDVHETALFLQQQNQNSSTRSVDTCDCCSQEEQDLILSFANRFPPESERPEGADDDSYDLDDEIDQFDDVRDSVFSTLWPVVAGEWLAGDLTTITNDGHRRACGKVFWNKE